MSRASLSVTRHAHVGVVLVIVMPMSLVDAIGKMGAFGLGVFFGLPQLRVHPVHGVLCMSGAHITKL